MSTSILQSFLRARLLDIGAEDTRLGKLHLAVDEVAESISKDPSTALGYILVGFDPKITSDPILDMLAAAVEKQWPTYSSAFADTPVILFRAVALDALRKVIETQPAIATAIVLLSRNLLPHIDLGAEKSTLTGLVETAATLMSVLIQSAWPTEESISIPELGAVLSSGKAPKIDRALLLTKVEGTVGPHNSASQAGESPNPYWTNSAQTWSYEFAPRMATILADLHDKAVENALSVRAKSDTALTQALVGLVQNMAEVITSKNKALERKVALLWWRETLYSLSAQMGYRLLSPEQVVAYMAIDLANHVPPEYPASVESFLRETVRSVVGMGTGKSEEVTLIHLVTALSKLENAALQQSVGKIHFAGSRRLVFQAILEHCTEGPISEYRPFDELGLPTEVSLPLPDYAIWLFREIQAMRALTQAEAVEPMVDE